MLLLLWRKGRRVIGPNIAHAIPSIRCFWPPNPLLTDLAPPWFPRVAPHRLYPPHPSPQLQSPSLSGHFRSVPAPPHLAQPTATSALRGKGPGASTPGKAEHEDPGLPSAPHPTLSPKDLAKYFFQTSPGRSLSEYLEKEISCLSIQTRLCHLSSLAVVGRKSEVTTSRPSKGSVQTQSIHPSPPPHHQPLGRGEGSSCVQGAQASPAQPGVQRRWIAGSLGSRRSPPHHGLLSLSVCFSCGPVDSRAPVQQSQRALGLCFNSTCQSWGPPYPAAGGTGRRPPSVTKRGAQS